MNAYQWFVFEGDNEFPSASGTAPNIDIAGTEMMHYTMMYGQDGPVRYRMDCDGEHLVLHAGHWAIDSRKAADELHATLLEMLDGCRVD